MGITLPSRALGVNFNQRDSFNILKVFKCLMLLVHQTINKHKILFLINQEIGQFKMISFCVFA